MVGCIGCLSARSHLHIQVLLCWVLETRHTGKILLSRVNIELLLARLLLLFCFCRCTNLVAALIIHSLQLGQVVHRGERLCLARIVLVSTVECVGSRCTAFLLSGLAIRSLSRHRRVLLRVSILPRRWSHILARGSLVGRYPHDIVILHVARNGLRATLPWEGYPRVCAG